MANKEVLWKTDMVRVEALSSLSSLEGEGGKKGGVVYVLEFCDGKENRMNFHFLSLFLKGLDEVEEAFRKQEEGTGAALITTSKGKFYSNGIDLKWLATQTHEQGAQFMDQLMTVVSRLLAFPMPTIAGINGHCYAGGFVMAMSHDYRVMRSDRGWMRLPAVDLGLRLPDLLLQTVIHKTTPNTRNNVILAGQKYTAKEALSQGLINEAVPHHDDVVPHSVSLAQKIGHSCSQRQCYLETKKIVNKIPLDSLKTSKGATLHLSPRSRM